MELFARTYELVNGNCYVDGLLTSGHSCTSGIAWLTFAIFAPLMIIGVGFIVWWFVTLIHVLTHDDVKDRVLWIVLHFVIGGIIAPIYYFAVQRPYNKAKNSSTAK